MVILRPLAEKLILADKTRMASLYSQMGSDAKFNKLLNTPVKNMPCYRFLVEEEISRSLQSGSLLDIIENTVNQPHYGYLPYFCVSGDKITAFFACFIEGETILYIKVFSFGDAPSGVLAENLVFFVKENLHKYGEIRWSALKNRPVLKLQLAIIYPANKRDAQ